ncbi:MAG: RibD family protein [Cyanobacteria bacterium P01_A01_bin.123]
MGGTKLTRLVHTTVILAISADGKIADYQRSPARFPSAQDRMHLEAAIASVDAVVFGAGTLRAYGTSVLIKSPDLIKDRVRRGFTEQPIHFVCSRSGQLKPDWRFFQQPFLRGLITTPDGAIAWGDRPGFDHLLIARQGTMDWPKMVESLADLDIRRLALLGGGTLVAQWLAADLVDELQLTICPLLLGGATSPTPVDGAGWLSAQAPRLQLLSTRAIADEVFLHYRVQRNPCPSEN